MTLEEEVKLGKDAATALRLYFKDYFDKENKRLYEEFCAGTLSDENRAMHQALARINTDLNQTIQSGQFAERQLGQKQ